MKSPFLYSSGRKDYSALWLFVASLVIGLVALACASPYAGREMPVRVYELTR